MENCLLFVLHVSAPPYIYFNYGFIIKEIDVTDNDKLQMRIIDLEKENKMLYDKLKEVESKSEKDHTELWEKMNDLQSLYQQQVQSLQDSIQTLQRKLDEEMKVERIDLPLQNHWVSHSEDKSKPEAIRMKNVVYLKGIIKGVINLAH